VGLSAYPLDQQPRLGHDIKQIDGFGDLAKRVALKQIQPAEVGPGSNRTALVKLPSRQARGGDRMEYWGQDDSRDQRRRARKAGPDDTTDDPGGR
jgi:hypothetical protein